MPLTRSMAESESACPPLPTTFASKPAPSTRLTSCFCKHQTRHQHMHVRETPPKANPKQDLRPSQASFGISSVHQSEASGVAPLLLVKGRM